MKYLQIITILSVVFYTCNPAIDTNNTSSVGDSHNNQKHTLGKFSEKNSSWDFNISKQITKYWHSHIQNIDTQKHLNLLLEKRKNINKYTNKKIIQNYLTNIQEEFNRINADSDTALLDFIKKYWYLFINDVKLTKYGTKWGDHLHGQDMVIQKFKEILENHQGIEDLQGVKKIIHNIVLSSAYENQVDIPLNGINSNELKEYVKGYLNNEKIVDTVSGIIITVSQLLENKAFYDESEAIYKEFGISNDNLGKMLTK